MLNSLFHDTFLSVYDIHASRQTSSIGAVAHKLSVQVVYSLCSLARRLMVAKVDNGMYIGSSAVGHTVKIQAHTLHQRSARGLKPAAEATQATRTCGRAV